MTDLERVNKLVAALDATCGYMLNAKIDLECGRTKATAIRTLDRGLAQARAALQQLAGRPTKCEECGKYPADWPSPICVGCDAYREHQS